MFSLILSFVSIGNLESRKLYSNALKEYFSDKIDGLCEDCKNRLNKNPSLKFMCCGII